MFCFVVVVVVGLEPLLLKFSLTFFQKPKELSLPAISLTFNLAKENQTKISFLFLPVKLGLIFIKNAFKF